MTFNKIFNAIRIVESSDNIQLMSIFLLVLRVTVSLTHQSEM